MEATGGVPHKREIPGRVTSVYQDPLDSCSPEGLSSDFSQEPLFAGITVEMLVWARMLLAVKQLP